MSEDTISMDSGGSYPRTEATMISKEDLVTKHLDNARHNEEVVGEEEDMLYETIKKTERKDIEQASEKVKYVEKPLEDIIIHTEAAVDINVEEKIESPERLKILRSSKFSREEFEQVRHEISDEEILEMILI